LAVDYVSKYGMNDVTFINYQLLSDKLRTPLTSVEASVKKLTSEIYEEVLKLIESNKEKVEKIARLLMEKEVIYQDELDNLI
jgi:ATP-dependent Zn protease